MMPCVEGAFYSNVRSKRWAQAQSK